MFAIKCKLLIHFKNSNCYIREEQQLMNVKMTFPGRYINTAYHIITIKLNTCSIYVAIRYICTCMAVDI